MSQALVQAQRKGVFAKGQATRQALMDAARTVFARDGFMRAEISAITEVAGKGTGTFYLYFDSKTQLLAAMVEAFAEEVRAPDQLATPTHAPEDIARVLRVLWCTYKRHAVTFRAMADAAVKYPEFDDMYRDIRAYALRDFTAMLRARQATGACRHLDAELAGAALEKMVNTSLFEWIALGQAPWRGAPEEHRAFETLVHLSRAILGFPAD